MSKTRALELFCENAIQNARSSEFESSILYLVDAIRELAKDEPDDAIEELAKSGPETTTLDEVVDRLDELIKAVYSLTEVCSDISRHTYDG